MPRADSRAVPWLLSLAALGVALVSARPYVGSWNDGSRLAAVESLAERGTLRIDDSPFTPATSDKLYIDRHFYSDKTPVASVLMAGMWKMARLCGLPSPAERPDLYCWTMTVATSGLAYLVCVLALHRLGRRLALPDRLHFLWLGGFALATFAPAYTQHVNSHILLLAVMALVMLQLLKEELHGTGCAWLGTLAGLGFNLDFCCGPLLMLGLFLLLAWRYPARWRMLAAYLLACAPWVCAALAIHQAVGGVWKPLNMVPEYLEWPGSPFKRDNITGLSRYGPLQFVVYALALLFGKKGVFVHNLPLLLLVPALGGLLLRRALWRAEALFAAGWCAASWLGYSFLSNNSAGGCLSIRWFVPFLAPGWFLLALRLRESPRDGRALLTLSGWGLVLAALMWAAGPWT